MEMFIELTLEFTQRQSKEKKGSKMVDMTKCLHSDELVKSLI